MPEFSPRTPPYRHWTPKDYLQTIRPEILNRFDEEQLNEVQRVLDQAISKPVPKIVDLRFVIDLIFSKFYVVLLLGKDRRRRPRAYKVPRRLTKISNFVTAVILLVNLNLFISSVVLVMAYLVKTAIGINLSDGFHMQDVIRCLS
ncbi:MAG: hypothetical protein AAF215_32630 [Cyanobacteria bacterium P01_A01_bin.123]